MLYCKETNTYYANETELLKHMIFYTDAYVQGLISWKVKEKRVEEMPNVFYIKKTYYLYCYYDCIIPKGRIEKKRFQKTVYELSATSMNTQFYTVEKYIEKNLQKDRHWTDYGKKYYSKVLEHFRKYQTLEELKNNLFRG